MAEMESGQSNLDKLAELAKVNLELSMDDLDEIIIPEITKTAVDTKKQIEEAEGKLSEIEKTCISNYMGESDNIIDLFQRVTSCDQILEQLETILCKFQANLGNLCQEIISLHEQTVSLKTQLKDCSTKYLWTEYVETMGKVYHNYFKECISRLSKLEYEDKPDENDLMAAEEQPNRTRSNMIFPSKPTSMRNRSTVFTLGSRLSVIQEDLEKPLVIPTINKLDLRYTSEAIFRFVHFALNEKTCREYFFLRDFFMTSGDEQTSDLFRMIFKKTLLFIESHFEEQFRTSFDAIAMLLCIHVIYRYRESCRKKGISALNSHWSALLKMLYPRFEKVVHMHTNSVRHCDCEKFTCIDTRPHYITRRYAEFASAISCINNTYPDERISLLLGTLQSEVKNFILRTAAIFRHPREQQIFMINNYDHILSVFKRSTVSEDSKDIEEIKIQLNKRIKEIVEELLYPHFGSMICFIKDFEVYLEKEDHDSLRRNEKKIGPLIESFNNNCDRALNEISKEVMNCFSNFENGNDIQQAALAQLLQYHMRFQKILSHPSLKDHSERNKLITLHELMNHVKKFKTIF